MSFFKEMFLICYKMVRNEVLTRKVVGIWLATCLKPLNCTGESIRIRFKVILIKLNIRLIIRLLNSLFYNK